jgi:hypothetical protein
MRLLLVSLLFFLTACSNLDNVVKELAQDTATVCAKIATIYGTMSIARTNIKEGDVKCDGLEVHSQGQTSIPVTIKAVSP